MFSLKDRVAIVTGARRGIGKAEVLALASAGANTVVVDLYLDEAETVAKEAEMKGAKSLALKADITDKADVRRMARETIKNFGKIDILVNNAGIIMGKPITEYKMFDWEKVFKTNLFSYYLCSREVCKYMIKQNKGTIINSGSVTANIVVPGRGVYAASKAGVVQLTRHLAVELGSYGIRANAVCPGPIETDINRQMRKNGADYSFIESLPIKRMGQPSEVAGAVVFLASDAASYITGTTITIDGGMTAI